jgi:hypothetical protein
MPRKRLDSMSEDATQLRELAGILARGVLRLRQRHRRAATPAPPAPETRPESAARGLEVRAKTVLSVSTRVNGPESLKPRSTKC